MVSTDAWYAVARRELEVGDDTELSDRPVEASAALIRCADRQSFNRLDFIRHDFRRFPCHREREADSAAAAHGRGPRS
jgi:hypothetical protein